MREFEHVVPRLLDLVLGWLAAVREQVLAGSVRRWELWVAALELRSAQTADQAHDQISDAVEVDI